MRSDLTSNMRRRTHVQLTVAPPIPSLLSQDEMSSYKMRVNTPRDHFLRIMCIPIVGYVTVIKL